MKSLFAVLLLLLMGFQALAVTTEELKAQLDVLAEEIQTLKFGDKQTGYNQTIQNRIRGNNVALGGYGEFVYTDASGELEDGSANSKGDPVWDAQRFILYIGYDFSPKWKLFTEIEIEHADEIFLEQGFLQYVHSDELQVNVGVLLVPMGITNLYHEPTTFLATQRSTVEKKIIPTTWRENGISLTGIKSNVRYQVAMFNSLLGNGFSSDGVRGGRQKASKSDASGLSFAAQADYLIGQYGYVGASAYHGGVSGTAADTDQTVWDVHANMTYNGFQMRALYTELALSDVAALNTELSLGATDSIAEKMSGYYLEIGYNVLKGMSEEQIIPFFRYEALDTQAEVATGNVRDLSKDQENLTIGVNYKPLPSLVFKADYTIGKNEAKTGADSWNFGAGWNF